MANPGAAAKTAQKAAANAGEAAAQAGRGVPNKAEAIDWVKRANDLGVDKVAAKQLDEEFIPQLEEAGYSKSQIKALFLAEDPHAAARQFIDDEKMQLMESIGASGYGFTPDQMLGMSLKDLRETASSIDGKSAKPSRIRGKDPNASKEVDSRLPGAETATANAPLGAVPGEVPPVVPQPSQRKISAEKAARLQASEASKGNVEKLKETGSLEGVNWLGANRDPMMVGKDASRGDWSKITAEDMTGERGPVFKSLPDAKQTAQSGPQPKAGEVEQKVDAAVDQKPPAGPSLVKTDPLLRTGVGLASGAKWAAQHAPVTAATAAAALGGLGYGLGWFGGGQQPAPGQQPQPGQQGSRPPVQINILPRERLRELEQAPPRPMMQAPAPMQPPMQAPPQQPVQGQPRAGQTTDIIRQLAGRMA